MTLIVRFLILIMSRFVFTKLKCLHTQQVLNLTLYVKLFNIHTMIENSIPSVVSTIHFLTIYLSSFENLKECED